MDIYLKYDLFTKEVEDLEKDIRQEITTYKQKCSGNELTIDIENSIKNHLKQYKDLVNKLQTAYVRKNVPGGIPDTTIDKRQKQIQGFEHNHTNMEKAFLGTQNEKYGFKNFITEDYSQKEEYKNMSNDEMMALEKKRLDKQEERLDEICVDVKKGQVLAKNAGKVMKEQNKKLDQINEDIERTDERMNTLTGRFEKYVASTSMCKMIFIMIIEIVIGILAIVILL